MNPYDDSIRPTENPITGDPAVRRGVRPEPTPSLAEYRTIAALFDKPAAAQRAIEEIKASTLYEPSEIGVAIRDRDTQEQVIQETDTHAVGGAVSGAAAGGVLGGLAGWLMAIGALSIPGVGPVVAGGALASALGATAATTVAGAGIGAATGGLIGALIGLGLSKEHAEYYERGFREGRVIVTVRARDLNRAIEILQQHGGHIHPSLAPVSTSRVRPSATTAARDVVPVPEQVRSPNDFRNAEPFSGNDIPRPDRDVRTPPDTSGSSNVSTNVRPT